MEHLFNRWPDISARIEAAAHIMVFSDFDGTLAPIVARPEAAALPKEAGRLLRLLAGNPRIDLAIVSGRALDDLKARINIDGIIYIGNHGLEAAGPAVTFTHPVAEATRPTMRKLLREMAVGLGQFAGVIVEDKGLTLSIHYRLVEEAEVADLEAEFRRLIDGTGPDDNIRITSGKMVREIRPAVEWNKGSAVEMLVRSCEANTGNQPLAIFLGDDITDEDGFKAVDRLGGISVLVGRAGRETSARYYLESVDEVNSFLDRLSLQVG